MDPLYLMRGFGLEINSIIHVGANTGQERFAYRDAGVKNVLFVEPISTAFKQLSENISGFDGFTAKRALCSDVSGEIIRFNVASNGGESSSMFGLGAHAVIYPGIVYTHQELLSTITLDSLLEESFRGAPFSLLVVDTQGADLKVLKGAAALLKRVDAVFVEVSEEPLYEGGCTLDEVSTYLSEQDFRVKWLEINEQGWGNALYVNQRVFTEEAPDLPISGPNIALNKLAKQSSESAWSNINDAQGGVNGTITGSFSFHTESEYQPWWQVDLERITPLKEIRIHNRCDWSHERARSLKVLISDDDVSWREVHDQKGVHFGRREANRVLRIFPAGESARFIRIQLNDTNYLHLDEIEVY